MRTVAMLFVVGLLSACSQTTTGVIRDANPASSWTITNARIWTGDRARPWAEAVAIDGDRIAAIGTSDEIRRTTRGDAIDAGGRLVVPGFIDSHVHFISGGFRLASVQLRDAKTREAFAARLKAFA